MLGSTQSSLQQEALCKVFCNHSSMPFKSKQILGPILFGKCRQRELYLHPQVVLLLNELLRCLFDGIAAKKLHFGGPTYPCGSNILRDHVLKTTLRLVPCICFCGVSIVSNTTRTAQTANILSCMSTFLLSQSQDQADYE